MLPEEPEVLLSVGEPGPSHPHVLQQAQVVHLEQGGYRLVFNFHTVHSIQIGHDIIVSRYGLFRYIV